MHTLLELAAGSTPSSRKGFRVRVLTADFVQSLIRFFTAVEAEEALVATTFFVFPIAAGKHCSVLEGREMAQDEMSREAGARKKKGMQQGKCGNSVVRG
jgi:hypothetical protein